MKKKYLFLTIVTIGLIISSSKVINNVFATEIDTANISVENVNDKSSNLTFSTSDFKNLTSDDLIQKRDKLIDENLSADKSFSEKENKRTKKNLLLNDSWTLVGYVEYKYPNLDDREKLMKQINLIQFANFLGHRMDPSGEYFVHLDESSQYDDFLKFKKREDLRDISSTNTVKEKMKYLAENIDELSSFVTISEEKIVDTLTDSFRSEDSLLSDEERNEISNTIENFKPQDINLYNLIKESIQQKKYEENIFKNPNTAIDIRTTPSEYRSAALYFAKRHGYSNSYYNGIVPSFYVPRAGRIVYFTDYSNNGGDCANFVSMCLAYSGVNYWTSTYNNNGWFFFRDGSPSLNTRSTSWAGASGFRWHFQRRVPAHYKYVHNELRSLREATPVSILTNYGNGKYEATHTLITTNRHSNGYNFSYAAHSDYNTRTNLVAKLRNKEIKYYEIYW